MEKSKDDLPFTFTDRESRAYIHDQCGAATEVSGMPLFQLVDPTEPLRGTRCAKCGVVPLSSVRWEDSGETVSDYRQRILGAFAAKLPSIKKTRIVIGVIVLILAAVAFIVKLIDNKGGEGLVIAGLGSVAGLVFAWLLPYRIRAAFFTSHILRRKIRLKDVD